MSGELIQSCVCDSCICDTTKIAWGYISDHRDIVLWAIGGIFGFGMFCGWAVTTLKRMENFLDSTTTRKTTRIEYDGEESDDDQPVTEQFLKDDVSSDNNTNTTTLEP